MKEFNKKFPYLRLGIFYSYARQQVAKGERITNIDVSKTLASVRRAASRKLIYATTALNMRQIKNAPNAVAN